MAVIAASYLHLEPALSFDLAALGMFLFLAYAVVLLCASAQGTRRHTLAAFTGLMVAFAAGCLVGRLGMALCFALVEQFASNIMVLLSILAANAAMIILVRRGVTPIRSAELFEGEQATGDLKQTAHRTSSRALHKTQPIRWRALKGRGGRGPR